MNEAPGLRAWTVPASASLHATAVTILLCVPLLGPASLPEPRTAAGFEALPAVFAVRMDRPAPPMLAASARPPLSPRALVAQAAFEAPDPVAEPGPVAAADTGGPCSGCVTRGEDIAGSGTEGGANGLTGSEKAGPQVGAPVRVGSGVEAPRKLTYVVPRYPDLARRAGVEGVVVLQCVVDPAGHVAEVEVLQGHPLLNASAVEAVRQWRYAPTRLNGIPVAVVMTVTVQFRIAR